MDVHRPEKDCCLAIFEEGRSAGEQRCMNKSRYTESANSADIIQWIMREPIPGRYCAGDATKKRLKMLRVTVICPKCSVLTMIDENLLVGNIDRDFHRQCPLCDTENITHITVNTKINEEAENERRNEKP